jgi:hypothetical protein
LGFSMSLIYKPIQILCQNYKSNQLTNLSRCQQNGLQCLPCQMRLYFLNTDKINFSLFSCKS